MFGIDVSENNGTINWDLAKNQISFAILRTGWIGNTSNRMDTQFERNYAECKRLGIPIGMYIYCYSKTVEAITLGANWILERINGKSLELPIFIDMEDESISNLGKENLTNMCIAFNTVMENAGLKAGVYANKNWYDNFLNKEILKSKYATWIAHYGIKSQNAYQGEHDMWQSSSNGQINGIKGNVDTNFLYTDFISGVQTSQKDYTTQKSNEQIADEVIAGKWGTGQDRKDKLTSAGYDYDAIQRIVNLKIGARTEQETNERLADEVIAGKWGVGQDRINRLTSAGYDYDAIQKIVNEKMKKA